MPLLTRNDLIYTYTWNFIPQSDLRINGILDSTPFNRREGYEVLYLINRIAELYNILQKETGLKIEKTIITKLPANLISQKAVTDWVLENIDLDEVVDYQISKVV